MQIDTSSSVDPSRFKFQVRKLKQSKWKLNPVSGTTESTAAPEVAKYDAYLDESGMQELDHLAYLEGSLKDA